LLLCAASYRIFASIKFPYSKNNLVFEAGLFLAAHGRERTQLLLPEYADTDVRKKVAVPSDILGLTWNSYAWSDDPVDATGLPATARVVCDQLATLGPRARLSLAIPSLRNHDRVEAAFVYCGDWVTIAAEVIVRLGGSVGTKEIDILSAYRSGEIRRVLDAFRQRSDSTLRACFANFWDAQLADVYRRKYYDRTVAYMQDAVRESIRSLLGPCELTVGEDARVTASELTNTPNARYEIGLTQQRITFSYYRVDRVAVVVPLDMKRAQNPAPYAWVIDANTAPRTFDHYRQQYDQMFVEASLVYPSQ
jgi:hypothetical protein